MRVKFQTDNDGFEISLHSSPSGHAGTNIQCPPEQIDHLPPVKMVGFRRSKLTTL